MTSNIFSEYIPASDDVETKTTVPYFHLKKMIVLWCTTGGTKNVQFFTENAHRELRHQLSNMWIPIARIIRTKRQPCGETHQQAINKKFDFSLYIRMLIYMYIHIYRIETMDSVFVFQIILIACQSLMRLWIIVPTSNELSRSPHITPQLNTNETIIEQLICSNIVLRKSFGRLLIASNYLYSEKITSNLQFNTVRN